MSHIWNKTIETWNTANWTWAELELVDEIVQNIHAGAPGNFSIPPWIQHPTTEADKKKRRRFIQLLCKINSKKYTSEKEVKTNIKITVSDIKQVVKAVRNIDLELINKE
jgi:hypothetical protein